MRHGSNYAVENRGPPMLEGKLGGEGCAPPSSHHTKRFGGERKL